MREPGLISVKEGIFKTVWELKKRGYADSTIKGYARKLKTLSKLANLDSPESVRGVIARKQCSNAFKEALANAYDHYVRVNGLSWNKPLYKRQRNLPYIATTEQINKVISRASRKYALIFSILRDTGMRPISARSKDGLEYMKARLAYLKPRHKPHKMLTYSHALQFLIRRYENLLRGKAGRPLNVTDWGRSDLEEVVKEEMLP